MSDMSHKDFWVKILERLNPTIKRAHFLTWFQSTTVLNVEKGRVTIGVPTVFALNWISSKYEVKILQAASELNSDVRKIDFDVCPRLSEDDNFEAVDVKALF